MKITKIFIDLDDTLNSFTMPALREVGCQVSGFDYAAFNPSWGMDIVRAANELHPSRSFSGPEFWNLLSEGFWAHTPPSLEVDWLLDGCADLVGKGNVCILTAFHPEFEKAYVASAKADWIRDFLPPWLHSSFLIGPNKTFCAHPGALLIDDSDKNVREFKVAGGEAIIVPRPWNSLHSVPTLKWVQFWLNQLKESNS